MKSLSQYITELFNTGYKFSIAYGEDDNGDPFPYYFIGKNGQKYYATFFTEKPAPHWFFDFGIVNKYNNMEAYKLTGLNDLKIYNTLFNIIKDFIGVYNPNKIDVSGTSGKRTNLYKRIITKYHTEFEKLGYKLTQNNSKIYLEKI